MEIRNKGLDIEENVNPDRPNATMTITKGVWRVYKNLFNYSRIARYEGITDMGTFKKLKEEWRNFAEKAME